MTVPDIDHSGAGGQVRDLHQGTVVVDTLAGGPGVFTATMHHQLAQLDEGLPRPEFFRELQRLITSAFLTGEFSAYWQAIRQSMVDVLSITVGAWGDTPFSFRGAVYDLGEWHRRFAAVSQFRHITSPASLRQVKQSGTTGVLLGFQNSTQLERDVRNAETFHGLGVRMIQLTYNDRSDAGDGCMQATDEGLTAFGRELISCMNDLGLIVDLSHCGPRTTMEAIEWSRAPVAVSHAACAALHPHPRNKTDEVLRALAATGGYIGVCAVPAFLTDQRKRRPSVAVMADHILHAVDLCGQDRVGIGSDWGVAKAPEPMLARLRAEARSRGFREEHRFDFASTTDGFERWSVGFPRITQALIDAGLPATAIKGVLGENFCRFYERVTAAAGTEQHED
ncbi:MAG TPA: membrane dipeptidase [Streptosporangiaceae bacterium]